MSQAERLYNLLKTGQAWRTDQIVSAIYGEGMSLSRVGARIFDIKKKHKVEIKGWKDERNPKLYWYQIATSKPQEIKRAIVPKEVIGKALPQPLFQLPPKSNSSIWAQ